MGVVEAVNFEAMPDQTIRNIYAYLTYCKVVVNKYDPREN